MEVYEERQAKLLGELYIVEQEYLLSFYKPKERQFIRVYTRLYRNLGTHTT
jgi:hypothetical protein